jgi:hypothetical protein
MVRGYKKAETKTTSHVKNMRGRYIVLYVTEGRLHEPDHRDLVDALGQDWPEVSDVSMMLNSPWPEGCEDSAGCAWALVLVGETVTKECHPGRACRCDCPAHTADSNSCNGNPLFDGRLTVRLMRRVMMMPFIVLAETKHAIGRVERMGDQERGAAIAWVERRMY